MRERLSKSERFLKALAPYGKLLVVAHDNPDPDAVATGWAVCLLIKERLGKPVRLLGAGDIVRAENRQMVRLLEPPIELVCGADLAKNAGVVLVDCQPGNGNCLFCDGDLAPAAVIDHHAVQQRRGRTAFRDVRPGVAASASIAASYLREQKIEPGTRLATALLFALRTETSGNETHYSRLDRAVLVWLSQRFDPSCLAAIENAPLAKEYYGDLLLALKSTFLYGDTAFCLLPRAGGAEIAAEVADLLIRCDTIWRVLCGAVVGEDLFVSVRTEHDDEDAAQLVQKTLAGLGRGGGHRRRAGGKIPGVGPKVTEELQEQLRDRWLSVAGVGRQRGTRLVSRREIVEDL